VAKLIQFYVPDRFRPREDDVRADRRGKVIEFRPKDADENNRSGCERSSRLTAQSGSAIEVPFRWP
jgi:hypothetical protein